MRSVFFSRLVNDPFGDPALYVRQAHRGSALLFDCGDLHSLTGRELLKTRLVFLSHAHIDHLIGFDRLLRVFLNRSRTLVMYGPCGLIERMTGRLAGYTWNLVEGYPFVLVVREWRPHGLREMTFRAAAAFRPQEERWLPRQDGLLHAVPWLRVRAVRLEHGDIASLAFALEEPLHVAIHRDALERRGYAPGRWLTRFKNRVFERAAADVPVAVPLKGGGAVTVELGRLLEEIASTERGMKIGYVTDAAPTPGNIRRIIELAADAHLLAIEAMFSHDDLDRARTCNHLTAHLAGRIGRLANAARLLVFHHSPRYQSQPDRLQREAQAAFEGRAPA